MSATVGVIIAGAIDLTGRVITLLYQTHHSEVRRLGYRTWVLLNAFLNFAWVFYWLCGKAKRKKENSADETGNRGLRRR